MGRATLARCFFCKPAASGLHIGSVLLLQTVCNAFAALTNWELQKQAETPCCKSGGAALVIATLWYLSMHASPACYKLAPALARMTHACNTPCTDIEVACPPSDLCMPASIPMPIASVSPSETAPRGGHSCRRCKASLRQALQHVGCLNGCHGCLIPLVACLATRSVHGLQSNSPY